MENIDLSDFFKTIDQAREFTTRLSRVGDKIYQNNFSLETSLSEEFGIQKKDKFMALLRNNQVATNAATPLKDFFTKLHTYVSSLPTLTITVAFEPKEQTLKLLTDWFMLNIKRQVLFDIKMDPELIAGAIINFNGKYLDFSMKEKFREIIKTQGIEVLPQPAKSSSAEKLPSHPLPVSGPSHHMQALTH